MVPEGTSNATDSLPANHGYRRENPELCEQIGHLPTLKIDRKLARAAVKKAKVQASAPVKGKKKLKIGGA